MNKYTIKQFRSQFPDDATCLDYIFKARFGSDFACPHCGKAGFYPIKKRKCYCCAWCGFQIHPVSGTIFHKSPTKLSNWLFAIYLVANSRNGVSATTLQRHLGCTYKTAWRIAHKIRSLMGQDAESLNGTIEADETYIGGKRKGKRGYSDKIPVMGMVERGGRIKSNKIPDSQTHTLLKQIRDNVMFGSRVITDDYGAYKAHKIKRLGYSHDTINHSKEQYAKGDIYTNTIEGAFSQLKRSISGTYHSISAKHLQSYVNEFCFSYNARLSPISAFETLLSRLCGLPYLRGQKIVALSGVKISS